MVLAARFSARNDGVSASITQTSAGCFAELDASGKAEDPAAVADRALQRRSVWQTPRKPQSVGAGRDPGEMSGRRPRDQQPLAWSPMLTASKQSGAVASGQTAIGSGTYKGNAMTLRESQPDCAGL